MADSHNLVLKKYFTETEEAALFLTVRSSNSWLAERDFAWMTLLRETGIRVGSLAMLTVGHAHEAISTKTLRLSDEICKRGKGYEVFCNKDARAAFKLLITIIESRGLSLTMDAPLIVSERRKSMSIRSFQHRTRWWAERAGIVGNVSPHWFRHTLGKRIMKHSTSNNPLGVAQAVLGHCSITTTGVYTRPDKEDISSTLGETRRCKKRAPDTSVWHRKKSASNFSESMEEIR